MKTLLVLPSALMLAGCASLLPSVKQEAAYQWQDFTDAKASYDEIVPFITDFETARKLGFDPYQMPNVKILNHAQVVEAVLPSPIQGNGGVPLGLQACIRAQEGCRGYQMEPARINRDRVGNFWLDLLNFKRETVTAGWRFSALIVIIDNKVVYKQWSGSPNIMEDELSINPLGPLQSVNPLNILGN
jgi:hypothetical protein